MKKIEYTLAVGPECGAEVAILVAPNNYNPMKKIKEWQEKYLSDSDEFVNFSNAGFDAVCINAMKVHSVVEDYTP